MKKLISTLLIFATTTIVCMTTAMASFAVGNQEMSHHNMMQKKMMRGVKNCCKTMKGDCEKTAHKCCISPFPDSGITSNIDNISSKKENIKGKIIDFSFLALLQENLEKNYIHRLNSPPYRIKISKLDNFYITLIGIIKNNC